MTSFADNFREWKESGVIKYVKWHTVNDDDVCDLCRLKAEKDFLLDEIETLYPGCDDCRCWFTPIVDIDLFEQQIKDILDGKEGG